MTSETSSSPAPNAFSHDRSSSIVAMNSVVKPSDLLSSPKLSPSHSPSSPPDSLRRLMTSGSMLKSPRSPFALDFERLKKKVESKNLGKDPSAFDMYGYGYGADEAEKSAQQQDEFGAKRRRFQRRNSKTPAMLMAMNSPLLLHLDFLEDKKEFEKSTAASPSALELANVSSCGLPLPASTGTFDDWAGGLAIAEDIVMQLQKRKRSTQP
jgi:hypothetical protein